MVKDSHKTACSFLLHTQSCFLCVIEFHLPNHRRRTGIMTKLLFSWVFFITVDLAIQLTGNAQTELSLSILML